jgi:two-component sensor histidine kinase
MGERKRVISLILILVTSCVIVAGLAMFMLYRAALEEQRARLVETAQSQARLIEAMARFDARYSKDYPGGPDQATLSQIVDAHNQYRGFGETGEFTLARRQGAHIVFLLRHRHFDLESPKPVPFNSELAEPMRRALSGLSGTVVGLDYRGELVLAAYEPVKELNLGIVAKIDLAEIRAPFVRAGLIAAGLAIVVVLTGTWLFLRVTNPIIEALQWELAVNAALAKLYKPLISPASSIEDISLAVLKQARGLTGSAHGYVSEIDPTTGDHVAHTLTEMMKDRCRVPAQDQRIVFPRGDNGRYGGLWGHSLNTLEAFFTNEPKIHQAAKTIPEGHVPIERFLSVPVMLGDHLVGQIALANKDEDYTDRDLEAIRRVSESYAVAVQRKRAEARIKESLREKEVLLSEIHHRVKNNLQIISSILNLSSMGTKSKDAIDLLQDARSKVYTMALIHSQLYQQDRFDQIDMGGHIRQLATHVSQSYADKTKSVHTVVEPSDVYLTVNQAIPCGLVVNELLTNAFKHAFEERAQGIVEVSVRRSDDDMILIRVKDDGSGLPQEIDTDKPQTLGLELVRGLAKQLMGTVQFKRDHGTEVILQFKVLSEEKHVQDNGRGR